MKAYSYLIVATLFTMPGGFAHPASTECASTSAVLFEDGGWVAKEDDNICGISDLKKVTNPAKVDYGELLESTPQIREMKRKGIDPESTEGKALRKGARTLITKTSELVRVAKGHCSVWKVISHKDGRKIPDVTEDVIDRF